jgi:hypothetical protein
MPDDLLTVAQVSDTFQFKIMCLYVVKWTIMTEMTQTPMTHHTQDPFKS